MLPFLFFVFLTAPVVLRAEENTVVQSTASTTVGDSLSETSNYHKAVVNASARKPKRANGEIPLLIIRPIDHKKMKGHHKEPGVKIMSGGVASYGSYPDIHTSDAEIFSLEHMLPILGLEGMVFKGMSKYPHLSNHFVPSQQYKPSDVHFLSQKNKEDFYSTALGGSHFKPTEADPSQPQHSPPPANYAPAMSTEDQLLKLGQQAISKLETPGSSHQDSYSPLVQEKPAFVKPEQLPTKYHFTKLQFENGQMVKSIPLTAHPGYGPTFFTMHNEIMKHHKPMYGYSSQPQYKYHEHHKKPQMVSPLSINTSFYYPKNVNSEDAHQQQPPQQQQQQHKTYYQSQQPGAPQTQTHVNYYFPKEIEPLPHPQPVTQQHTNPQTSQNPSIPVSTVQNGEHVDFVVPQQPAYEAPTAPSEKPYKPYNAHLKHKFQKQPQSGQQGNYYIHKQFEFSGKPNGNDNNIVTEYYGSHNQTTVETQHLPEPAPYSAPQYLPLPQALPLQQPAPALTLHQTHPVHAVQPQPFHHNNQGSSQSHWKLARRNHNQVKPVVEAFIDSEPDNSHSPTSQSGKALKPVEKSTTEVKVDIKHITPTRPDEKHENAAASETGTFTPTTRTARNGW